MSVIAIRVHLQSFSYYVKSGTLPFTSAVCSNDELLSLLCTSVYGTARPHSYSQSSLHQAHYSVIVCQCSVTSPGPVTRVCILLGSSCQQQLRSALCRQPSLISLTASPLAFQPGPDCVDQQRIAQRCAHLCVVLVIIIASN